MINPFELRLGPPERPLERAYLENVPVAKSLSEGISLSRSVAVSR